MHLQLLKAKYGGKIIGDPTSYGNDIFMSNGDRPSDYGIEMFQGNLSDLNYSKFTISYLFNSKSSYEDSIYRKLEDDTSVNTTNFFFFALKSDLFNRYYDY